MIKFIRPSVSDFHPAYFALVMATGIVSIALFLLDFTIISHLLFFLNIFYYMILVIILIFRLIYFTRHVINDLFSHQRGMGFFTLVAGTAVLGNQFLVIEKNSHIAYFLWIASTLFWILLTYTIFSIFTIKHEKPSLDKGIHGGWLVSVVAAQSISVLTGLLSHYYPSDQNLMLFFGLVIWLGGGMLYIWIMTLIFYRYTFFTMLPTDLAPPYWINMGAMAISTLAGTFLISESSHSQLLTKLSPFLIGMTLLFWSIATWWIPLLIVLGIWRHVFRKVPLSYDPVYWSAVFPLGMYTVCTYRLSQALEIPQLLIIPKISIYVTFTAWCIATVGLVSQLIRTFGNSTES